MYVFKYHIYTTNPYDPNKEKKRREYIRCPDRRGARAPNQLMKQTISATVKHKLSLQAAVFCVQL